MVKALAIGFFMILLGVFSVALAGNKANSSKDSIDLSHYGLDMGGGGGGHSIGEKGGEVSQTPSGIKKLKSLFNFSKTHTNILVIILDRSDGFILKENLNLHPEIFSNFKGFIHFPNALSTSGVTLGALPSIIGGEAYTARELNQQPGNLKQKIAAAYAATLNAFFDAGYEISVLLDYPLEREFLTPLLREGIDSAIDYVDYHGELMDAFFVSRHMDNEDLRLAFKRPSPLGQLASLGLFKAAPFSLRKGIYKEGGWLFASRINKLSPVSELFAFKENLDSGAKRPTFKFFHFDTTHFPYLLDSNCEFSSRLSDLKHEKDSLYKLPVGHYNSEVCAYTWLNEALKSMQYLGIYDNTEIFILSDHGAEGSSLPIKHNLAIPFLYKPAYKQSNTESKTGIKTDSRVVANYDIASIFCENIKSYCKGVKESILKNHPRKREIQAFEVKFWRIQDNPANELILGRSFVFRNTHSNSIWDSKNWLDP